MSMRNTAYSCIIIHSSLCCFPPNNCMPAVAALMLRVTTCPGRGKAQGGDRKCRERRGVTTETSDFTQCPTYRNVARTMHVILRDSAAILPTANLFLHLLPSPTSELRRTASLPGGRLRQVHRLPGPGTARSDPWPEAGPRLQLPGPGEDGGMRWWPLEQGQDSVVLEPEGRAAPPEGGGAGQASWPRPPTRRSSLSPAAGTRPERPGRGARREAMAGTAPSPAPTQVAKVLGWG